MRERMSTKRFAVLVGLSVAFVAAVAIAHRWQVRRNAGGLLDLAVTAESQGKGDRAAALLTSYLALRPGDTDARVRYAKLVMQIPQTDLKSRRALSELLEFTLTSVPDCNELREKLVRIYIQIGQFNEAASHLVVLNEKGASDPEREYLSGVCAEALGEYRKAEDHYKLALKSKSLASAVRLAWMIRRIDPARGKHAKADEIMDQLVKDNPTNSAAYLARSAYLREFEVGDPVPDLAEALRLEPDNLEARMRAAEATPDHAQARTHLQAALAKHPDDPRIILALAIREARAGETEAGLSLLRKARTRFPGNENLLVLLAELQLNSGRTEEAATTIAELERWKRVPEKVAVFRGRLCMAVGDWREARDRLLACQAALTTAEPLFAAEVRVLLGGCHEQTGEDDNALAIYRRAASDAPKRKDIPLRIAQVLERLGRWSEAAQFYRERTRSPDADTESWLVYARLCAKVYSNTNPKERKAADLDEIFQEVSKHVGNSTDLVMLRADVLELDGNPAGSRKLLETALDSAPQALAIRIQLARLYAREHNEEAAWKVLDAADAASRDEIAWHWTRLDLLTSASDPRAKTVLAEATQVQEKIGIDKRMQLSGALAETYARWKAWPESRRLWLEVAKLRPTDLAVRFRLFELAGQADDRPQMESAVREIWQACGKAAEFGHYAEALLRVARPKDRTRDRLREASQHLATAARLRPTWSSVPAAKGAIADFEGKPDEALTCFRQAIDLGDRREEVLSRAVRLLCDRQQYDEADRIVRLATATRQHYNRLNRLAAEVSLFTSDTQRAVDLASAAVTSTSTDASDYLWQAEILAGAKRPVEAVAALRKAMGIAGSTAAIHVALVRQLSSFDRPAAEQALADLEKHLKGVDLAIARAMCLKLLSRPSPEIERAWTDALASFPDNLDVVRQFADFHERNGSMPTAIPALQQALAKPDLSAADRNGLRRVLAMAVSAKPAYSALREAIALIDLNLAEEPDNAVDILTKSRIFSTRLSHRRDALAAVSQLRGRGPLPADIEFYLGQLLADTGSWSEGRRLMQNVVTRGDSRREQDSFLIDRLIVHGELSDAEVYLDRLEKIAPDEPQTVRLAVLLLAHRKQTTDAIARLRRFASSDSSKSTDTSIALTPQVRLRVSAQIAENAAGILGSPINEPVNMLARDMFERAMQSGLAVDCFAAAGYAARSGRFDRAIELCLEGGTKATPIETAAALLAIADSSPLASEAQLSEFERKFLVILEKVPPSANREVITGGLHARLGRYREAAEAFRKAVAAGGGASNKNNLAYMLVLSGQPDDALRLLPEVITETGLSASVLDTRGSAYLALGRVSEAIADLEQAVEQAPTAANCLHLAAAYQAAGRKDYMLREFSRTEKLMGDGSTSSPSDQKTMEQLRAQRTAGMR